MSDTLWGIHGVRVVDAEPVTETEPPSQPTPDARGNIMPKRVHTIPHWISGYLHPLACDGKADHYTTPIPAAWFDITDMDIEGEPALAGMKRVYLIYNQETQNG